MFFTRVGYGDVEHKRDLMPNHIGFDPGGVIEFAVLFKVYSNFMDIAGGDCLLKTLHQDPAKLLTAILLKKRTDAGEIFPVGDSNFR